MKGYDHKKIEKKWQEFWERNKIYTTLDQVPDKDNFFLLVEFPYPSGNLHVGHWYAFAVPDILARTLRMQGKNVLYPIGFDAFGLPAENAAIKNKLNPREWTYGNIAYMKKQIRSMGTSFDWSRELATCDPEYYKWTQWLFLQLHKKGLVYQKDTAVNWCPSCKTVLANEQVIDGKCERCGTEVVQKMMLQWNIKITDYADRLVDDLDELDWPEQIKESQRNWIGRSEGAEIGFETTENDTITVFTTRADTLFGAMYLVLAPEHPWLELALEHTGMLKNEDEIGRYIALSQRKTELERMTDQREKTGVRLEGVEAINPASGEKMPIYVADYVLGHYGTGAIMAVPAHDERDYEFAKKFDLEIRDVIEPLIIRPSGRLDSFRLDEPAQERTATMALVRHWSEDKYMCLRWIKNDVHGFVTGGIEDGEDAIETAKREIEEETGYSSAEYVESLGGRVHVKFYAAVKNVNRFAHFTPLLFRLKDGSRSVVDERESNLHEPVWVDADKVADYLNREDFQLIWRRVRGDRAYTGGGILVNSNSFDGLDSERARAEITAKFGRPKKTYKLRDWIVSRQRYWGVPIPIVHCKKCGTVPVSDDQLPVLLPDIEDYLPSGEGRSPLAKVDSFVNVTCPKCGGEGKRETDTLDTFVDSSWYYLRYTDPKNEKEFASQEKMDAWMPIDLYSGGAEHTTMHVLYSRFWQKALFDMGLVKDAEPYTRRKNRSLILGPDGQKMSKSRGNVIDPDEVVERLGADTVRLYLAFIGPYNEVSNYPWNPDGVVGVRRFLERVTRTSEMVQEKDVQGLQSILHKTIKKVTDDIPLLKFNTAISQMMTFLNAIEKGKTIGREQWKAFVRILAPFAPHLAEELWREGGNENSVHAEAWPAFDEKYLQDETVTIAIQIDGKTRGEVAIPTNSDKDATEKAAHGAIAARLEGREVVRVVVVPKKLVNFVLKSD
ncbi:leucine--tRNA ligase [Candidatus Kaiserbacteria bacterium]|nr:leucine--tRNA ligase [Candidatus Kaiserbacteria bacterium]